MTGQLATTAVLAVENLTFTRPGGFALSQATFKTQAGRVTVLLGPNGAGKTTLVQCLCGLLRAHSGSVRILGYDIQTDRGAALSRLGLMLQEPSLDRDLTVRQNLIYFAALHGRGPKHARHRGSELLAQFGLSDLAGRKVRTLSGGQRRRVELVRALLNEPPFLLLDEPTVGLDIPNRNALVAEVHRLATERGTGVLWTTHLVDELWEDDDLIVLAQGRVAATGTLREVLAKAEAGGVADAFDRLTAGARAPGRGGLDA
jgi:ABC-2 type transport system ATP-binding protein